MNYIINPYVFYWMDVFAALSEILMFIGAGLVVYVFGYTLWFLLDDGTLGEHKRFVKKLLCLTAAVILVSIFIPSEDTMIKILIAKTATAENIGLTVDAIQSAVDYLVQVIHSVK